MVAPVTSLTRFIHHFSKRYRLPIFGLFLIGFLWAVHGAVSPVISKLIVDAVAEHTENLLYYVWVPLLAFLGMELLLLLLTSLYDYCVLKIYPGLRSDVIDELNQYIHGYSYTFFQNQLAGTLSNKMADLSKGTITILSTIIDDFFSRSLLFIFGLGTLFWVHPYFALVLAVWSVMFFILSYQLSKKSEKYSIDSSEARSTVMGKIVDVLTNIFTLKLFASQKFEERYLKKYLETMVEKEQRMHKYMLKLKTLQNLSITFLLFAMTALLIYTRQLGWITIGDFSLVLGLTGTIINQNYYLAIQFVTFSEEVGICKQALSLLAPSDARDPFGEKFLAVSQAGITFEDVSFEYLRGHPIFTNLNLQIAPGEKVGIVGSSGSGKSTLVHLLLRLYELKSGRILIGNEDITSLSRPSLARHIAMIPQDSSLFHRTILENIQYGKLNASEAEIVEAARKAHCDTFISKLQEGYQTIVGERGLKLSGGQRQRIAIARAILKDAPILILDEATSALDSVTEQQIQESLEFLMQGRTCLVIAHRLSTLYKMDRILLFEKGQIVEEGSHHELLEKNGRYAQLWRLQAGEAPGKLPYLV